MGDVFVVEAIRTPFCSFDGMLANIEAPILASVVIKELLRKSGLMAGVVDEVIIGQVLSGGCGQAPAFRRARVNRSAAFAMHSASSGRVLDAAFE